MTHLDWLLSPFTLYAASALCILTSLSLVVHMKLTLARTVGPLVEAQAAEVPETPQDPEVLSLKAEMEQLRESVSRLEESLPLRGSGSGLNLTKRAVALRMYRRGEKPTSIAAALETPLNEIALLVKLNSLTETNVS